MRKKQLSRLKDESDSKRESLRSFQEGRDSQLKHLRVDRVQAGHEEGVFPHTHRGDEAIQP